MKTFTLTIVQIIKPVVDVVTICFKQPGLRKVKYKAGQYLSLVVRINGRKFIRPYSLSSAPGIDFLLEVTVKRVPGGIVSNYLYDHVKEGDVMEVIEPMGNFVYDPELTNEHIMLWGAGSGITPLISIIKTALKHSTDKKVRLFYCNRNPQHTIFRQELIELKKQYKEKFTIWNFFTGIPEDVYLNYDIAGRIDEEKIEAIIADKNEIAQSKHFICGPQGLKNTVKQLLKKFNVPHEKMLTEEFEVLIDPEQFDDVETRIITITEGGKTREIEVIKGKSILDAGLDAGIELPYSCQIGTCMLCKAKLTNGKIKLIGVEKLPDEVAANECLLCCSFPYTNDIQILIN
jgi:ring-1,2-phenylacetyl-CoA epoxidase subunit PaaE